MLIVDAQREMRARFAGGFYAQLVSGMLWLTAATLATWSTPRQAILTIVIGGFFIYPMTELAIRLAGGPRAVSRDNGLRSLGMQVAFVLPLSMPLLVPVAQQRLTLFFPALALLVGAHYMPFVFLYGMRMFAVLGAILMAGAFAIAYAAPNSLAAAAWFTGAVLLSFAFVGRRLSRTN